jgi:hypothetical protein
MTWYDPFLARPGGGHETTGSQLLELARRRFGRSLTDAERNVLQQSISSQDSPSPDKDALYPEGDYSPDTPRPEVRAAILCWLATDAEARRLLHSKGIRVYSTTITGNLDLGEHAAIPRIDIRRSTVQGRLILEASEIRSLNITDCSLGAGIEADGVTVRGPVFLHRTQSNAEIRFLQARVESTFECQGARFEDEGDALSLDGSTFSGDVFLDECEVSRGEVRMLGAKISGNLSCTCATLSGAGNALSLDKVRIGGNLLLNRVSCCNGAIRLPNCHIGGDLSFISTELCSVLCYNMDLAGDLMWEGIKKTERTNTTVVDRRLRREHGPSGP